MKNTGIIYNSTEQTPAKWPAFADLLPALSEEQYAALEADILQNGCYSPIIVNEDMTIVDGHHRHEICEKHDLPYKIAVFAFEDDLEARQWALDTQKARRNLSTWELGQIALKLKPELEARAKEKEELRKTTFQKSEKSFLPTSNTTQELADIADTSTDTMNKIIQIDERAPDSVKEALNDGLSINAGYNITRLLEKLPEEAQEAAVERAVELAKKREDYKAAFDISLADMNALVKEDDEAKDAIRDALNTGELSVNGGKEVAGTLLDMPEEVRETAAADAEGLAELEADYREKNQAVDDNAAITKAYNAAFEHAANIQGAERDVRLWIEWAGIRKDEISDLIAEAEEASRAFIRIADTLRKIHEQEVAPYEEFISDDRPE